MKDSFITKFETDKYLIGSFDSYLEESLKLIMNKKNISEDEAKELFKKMPTTTRSAIVNKETGEYVGFIGISRPNGPTESADLFVETNGSIDLGGQIGRAHV